jgi:hypothetical protein
MGGAEAGGVPQGVLFEPLEALILGIPPSDRPNYDPTNGIGNSFCRKVEM